MAPASRRSAIPSTAEDAGAPVRRSCFANVASARASAQARRSAMERASSSIRLLTAVPARTRADRVSCAQPGGVSVPVGSCATGPASRHRTRATVARAEPSVGPIKSAARAAARVRGSHGTAVMRACRSTTPTAVGAECRAGAARRASPRRARARARPQERRTAQGPTPASIWRRIHVTAGRATTSAAEPRRARAVAVPARRARSTATVRAAWTRAPMRSTAEGADACVLRPARVAGAGARALRQRPTAWAPTVAPTSARMCSTAGPVTARAPGAGCARAQRASVPRRPAGHRYGSIPRRWTFGRSPWRPAPGVPR